MYAILSILLILWLSAFNCNGASIQPLDQPIKSMSSREFGLPQDLYVYLHSYLPVHGREGEAIVRGSYSEDPEIQARTADLQHEIDRRGLWEFLWSATKILINPTSWTTGIGLASLACETLGWRNSAPSWVTYTCNSFGIALAMFGFWSARSDLATAWNDERSIISRQLGEPGADAVLQ